MPVRGPVSEIDGLRSGSRRGQLPGCTVLSSSCCHFCLGGATQSGGDSKGGKNHRCIQVPEGQSSPGLPQ